MTQYRIVENELGEFQAQHYKTITGWLSLHYNRFGGASRVWTDLDTCRKLIQLAKDREEYSKQKNTIKRVVE